MDTLAQGGNQMRRLLFLGGLLLIVGSCIAWGQVPDGVGAASFARIGVDARPLAMAGAFVAVATGDPIPFYNPATLTHSPQIAVEGLYSQPYGQDLGITYQTLTALGCLTATQSESCGGIGIAVSMVRLDVAGIPLWDEDDPGSSGTFTATDALYFVSLGFPVADDWSVGVTAKLYRQNILQGLGSGFGFDVGVLGTVLIGDFPVLLGWTAADMGETNIRWTGTQGEPDNYVSWINRFGASTEFLDGLVLAACEVDWAVGRPARESEARVGAEINAFDIAYVRAGWVTDFEGTGVFRGGLGIEVLGRFAIDYAYVPGKNLGTTHFLSMHVRF